MLRLPQNRIIKKKKMREPIFLSPQTSNFQAQPVQAFHRKRKENLKQKQATEPSHLIWLIRI